MSRSEDFDAMFSLYQKGSLPISTILDLFEINASDVRRRLDEDLQ